MVALEQLVRVEPHGSIVLVRPLRDDVREHLEDNVQEDAQWFGGALVVEPRYVDGLLFALLEWSGGD